MDLPDFIRREGDEKAAEMFGVKPRTTMSWRLGTRMPRPAQAENIIEVTGGEVDWAGIYSPSTTGHIRKRRTC